jgi:hypothetical protein
MDLVTADQVKAHLRIDGTDEDASISNFILEGSSIVLDYIKKTEAEATAMWTAGSPPAFAVPGLVQAATLLVIGALYFNREGDIGTRMRAPLILSDAVVSLLARQRDPAIA